MILRVMILLIFLLSCYGFSEIINQKKVGKNTCGPCAFTHSLSLAKGSTLISKLKGETNTEKAKYFLEEYGSIDSGKYRKPAYQEKSGICDTDLLMMINKFMENSKSTPVAGDYVQRKKNESPEQFVKRYHTLINDSIQKGFFPLVSVRALAAEYSEEKQKSLWNSKGGHWVTICETGKIAPDNLGFTVDFLDSISGKKLRGYYSINLNRKAVVCMSFEVDEKGKEKWDWVSNDQTLELYAPGMPLGTGRTQYFERTFIAQRYVIYKD